MFTGIIEEVGYINNRKNYSGGKVLEIAASKVLNDIQTGDSIAINGACLSVTELKQDRFEVQVSQETLHKTTLGNLHKNDPVNLERALRANDRLDGHIVQGHVDDTGKIIGKYKQGDNFILKIEIPTSLIPYIVTKGSIAIDGISLTVAEINDELIKIALIPITIEETNLENLKKGDEVNLETDVLARYVESLLKKGDVEGTNFRDKIQQWGY